MMNRILTLMIWNGKCSQRVRPRNHFIPGYSVICLLLDDGFGWVCVRREPTQGWADEPDLGGLSESWEQLLSSGRPVNFHNIRELALNHNVKSGKWLFFADSGGKVDHLWSIVANAVINDTSPCNSAKVSTFDHSNRHVICIYNNDFNDHEQVLNAEQAIRNMGIKCKMTYKPDVYTCLNIYRRNVWGIPANIMSSDYDLLTGKSLIKSIR
ncbi:UPF0696 protein C11orf68 homolog isoform X2 [Ruditapes philippinarum]|uniref:UPF0696 protein C11orf68 homolog isoform X2 n=1 Tax=Ruditapes philippinarum TaxID=129788 RepID=UPI00295B6FBB|nr:UPF0696 protein C11orf68 homolog isoform X2 [Ruditapes philippinarum]XP_060588134.1 UPF0696 protein C11orf68 homolog isoform X2 [Ruditapes philippinarum]